MDATTTTTLTETEVKTGAVDVMLSLTKSEAAELISRLASFVADDHYPTVDLRIHTHFAYDYRSQDFTTKTAFAQIQDQIGRSINVDLVWSAAQGEVFYSALMDPSDS